MTAEAVKSKPRQRKHAMSRCQKERFSRERDELRQSKTRAVIRSFASRRSLGFLGAMRLSSSHFCSRAIMQKVDRMRCVLDTGVEQIMSRPGLRIHGPRSRSRISVGVLGSRRRRSRGPAISQRTGHLTSCKRSTKLLYKARLA